MNKIAIFGGTFNPIHIGHINIALGFINLLGLDKVIIIPNNIPPHKEYSSFVSSYDRLEMCKLAVKDYPKLEVSDIEIKRGGQSYTIDTIYQINKVYPNADLYLITGADMFLTIESWHRAEEIFKLVTVCAVPRNNDDINVLLEYSKKISVLGVKTKLFNAPICNISSTSIRSKIKNKESIKNIVPYKVEQYIYKNLLYME